MLERFHAMTANVSHIAEGGEYEALTFKFKQMLNRSTAVHFSTTPPLLAICCYVPFFLHKLIIKW